MAGTNWTQPLITDTYTAVLSELMTRDVSAATMFNSGMAADTSIPTGAIQWDATNLRFNIWSGSAWGALTPSYGFNISGTAAGLSATLAVTSGGTGVTTSTGSGSNVLSISPTLVTPALGTPTSGVLSNCTGYTWANITGAVTGILSTLGAAAKGANSDITSLTALTTPTTAANPMRVVDNQTQATTAFTTAGTSTAFTLTPVPAITALAANQRFRVNFNQASGVSPTLSISGLAATALMQYTSTGTLVAATLTAGQLTDVEYNGTYMVVLDPLPVATSAAGNLYNVQFLGGL